MTTDTDIADAQAIADAAPTYRATATATEARAAISGLDSLGLEAVEAKPQADSGYHDPSLVKVLYHQFDGRVWVGPAYMAPKLLAFRLPAGDARIPSRYVGMKVWETSPTGNFVPGDFLCLFNEGQPQAVKDELKALGIPAGTCTKAHFQTEFDADTHAQLKHKRRWDAYQKAKTDRATAADREAIREQSAAMVRMAEAIANGARIAPEPKEYCPVCDGEFDSPRGLSTHLRMSKDEAHTEYNQE